MSDKVALKAGIWYTASSFFVKSISFITTPIFTRILTKSDIGVFSVATTWISILTVILSLNLYDTVILARYDYKDEKCYKEYLSTIAILGTIVGMIFYVIVLFFQEFAVSITGIPLYAIHLVLVYIILSPCTSIILAKYRAEMKYGKTVVISLLSALSSAIISVLLVISWEDKLQGRFVGTYAPGIIINVLLLLFLVLDGKSFKISYCKYALPLGIPLIIHYLSGTLMGFSDRIMIQRLCGDEDVAIYTIAYTCALFVDIIRNSLNSAWDPWIFECLNKKKTEGIKCYTKYYLGFFLLFCVYIMLLAPELLLVFGGRDYVEAKYVIPPVVVGYVFCMIYSLFSCLERYAKKQKKFAIITFICAITNIALNLVLIPVFGYIAAAYTTLISYMLSCVLHYLNARQIGLAGIYDLKEILGFAAVSIIIGGVILVTYDYPILRYIIVCILTIIVLVTIINRRNSIKYLLKNIKS